jgi:AcrR family transcriptional regulator
MHDLRTCVECNFVDTLVFSMTLDLDLVPSRRERKKLATKQALHEAAFDLAESGGLAGVTIDAIAERADVAPRTFFNYFACKEDAVLDRDPERAAMLRQEVLARPASEDALTALRRVMESEMSRRVVNAELWVRRMRLIRSEPQLAAAMAAASEDIENALIEAVAERTGRNPAHDMYPALVVNAAWGAFKVAHRMWSHRGGAEPFDRLLSEAFDTLASGLTAPELR